MPTEKLTPRVPTRVRSKEATAQWLKLLHVYRKFYQHAKTYISGKLNFDITTGVGAALMEELRQAVPPNWDKYEFIQRTQKTFIRLLKADTIWRNEFGVSDSHIDEIVRDGLWIDVTRGRDLTSNVQFSRLPQYAVMVFCCPRITNLAEPNFFAAVKARAAYTRTLPHHQQFIPSVVQVNLVACYVGNGINESVIESDAVVELTTTVRWARSYVDGAGASEFLTCSSCGGVHHRATLVEREMDSCLECETTFGVIQLPAPFNENNTIDTDTFINSKFRTPRDILDYSTRANSVCSKFVIGKGEKLKAPPFKYPLFLGVELEVESRIDLRESSYRVAESLRGGAILKRDGSIGHGFEIVTIPATLAAQRVIWEKFFETKPHTYLSGWTSSNCGLHIHVSRQSLSFLTQGRINKFVNSERNIRFISDIAGRSIDPEHGNTYCRAQPSSAKFGRGLGIKKDKNGKIRVTPSRGGEDNRYQAVNISSTNGGRTMEFRIFRSNVGYNGFFRTLEFVTALCEYLSGAISVKQLTHDDFIMWFGDAENYSRYPELYKWMLKKEYLFGKKVPRATSKLPEQHKKAIAEKKKFLAISDESDAA